MKKPTPTPLAISIVSLVLLFLTYWFPPIELKDVGKFNQEKEFHVSSDQLMLIMEEHQKVVTEIQERSNDNTQWFYYKFLLMGALIGGVLAYCLRGSKVEKEQISFFQVIQSEIFLVTIGLAFIISVSIDIYISQNTIMVQQLGNWIAHQYEPLINWCIPTESNSDMEFRNNFKGWESFLRIKAQGEPQPFWGFNNEEQSFSVQGQHQNIFTSLFHFPSYYFLSWLIYILLLSSFYLRLKDVVKMKSQEQNEAKWHLTSILILTHFMIILFAIMSRSVPNVFEVKASIWSIPFIHEYISPVDSAFINIIIASLILLLNYLVYRKIWKNAAKDN